MSRPEMTPGRWTASFSSRAAMDRELPNSLFERLDRIEAALEQLLAAVRAKGKRGGTLPPQEWFSIEEAAALTGLSEDHVRRHVTSGLLPVSNQGTFET